MNRSGIVWEIKKGDLVRLKDFPGGEEIDVVWVTGLVISDIIHGEPQRRLWPSVNVYIFKTGAKRNCGPGILEIISCS